MPRLRRVLPRRQWREQLTVMLELRDALDRHDGVTQALLQSGQRLAQDLCGADGDDHHWTVGTSSEQSCLAAAVVRLRVGIAAAAHPLVAGLHHPRLLAPVGS
jgi:hypothetical protein